jgi:hypothetical protein
MLDFAEIANDWLNCEKCIYPENVSKGKTATASSQYDETCPPPKAVDGSKYVLNTYHSADSDRDPWWMVDLEQEYIITEVVLWNRVDCCQHRFQDITVEILAPDKSLVYASSLLNPGNTLPPKAGWTGPEKIVLSLDPTPGQFVRVIRKPNAPNGGHDTYMLSLAEVEVFAECRP